MSRVIPLSTLFALAHHGLTFTLPFIIIAVFTQCNIYLENRVHNEVKSMTIV